MGIVVSGIENLIVSLANMADRTSRGSREQMEQGAVDIRDLARLYAPVDKGNLEDAIKTGKELHGAWERGVNRRNIFTVEIDEDMPFEKLNKNGTTTIGKVGDYSTRMHEDWTYNLGVLSELKAQQTGMPVGPKFLERAMEDLDETIKAKVESRINQGIGH